jgi:7,8-dihydropterin-6-yl-methyl-4-(beta-D-ribofuranosyl)aminobenzene 5'-phosphate synthase
MHISILQNYKAEQTASIPVPVCSRDILSYSYFLAEIIFRTFKMVFMHKREVIMNGSDNSLSETSRVRVTVLTDNYYDALRPDTAFAKRYRTSPGKSIYSEHGLSYFIETESEGKTGACMFDFGMNPTGVLNNMELLDIDIGRADAFALSHGHFDHWAGSLEILRRNSTKIGTGTPFYVGKEAFLHRYSHRPGTEVTMDLGRLNEADLESSGVTIREIARPMEIIHGGYVTGNIERTTPYETPSPSLLVKRGDTLEPDDFGGEQALFFNIKNKGLIVISGCAHAGIVNTVRHIQNISGIQRVHAVLGGFHLINAASEKIWNTIADIREINPDIVAPMHCTGFEALAAFSSAMPEAFILNTAGTCYTFKEDD